MRKTLAVVVLVLSAFACAAFAYQSSPRIVWEYKAINIKLDKDTVKTLNAAGAEGWELVEYSEYQSTGTTVDAGTFFFKRQK